MKVREAIRKKTVGTLWQLAAATGNLSIQRGPEELPWLERLQMILRRAR
jgi:hypothetical protein